MEAQALVSRVLAFRALPAAEQGNSATVAALYNELTGESVACTGCNFRPMLYKINQLFKQAEQAASLTTAMADPTSKFRFKHSYKDVQVVLVHGEETRVVTAGSTLTDADVAALQAQNYGHIIEPAPAVKKAEPEAAADEKPKAKNK